MKFNGLPLLSLLLVCSLNSVSARHVCFNMKPMPDFDANKFIGIWYGIVTSLRPSQCLVNEFSHTQKFTNEDEKESGDLRDDDHPIAYKHFLVGELIHDPELPSAMTTYSTLPDVLQQFGASFVVFATDYVNYAGVYSCQDVSPGQQPHTVTIFSRTETLDELTIEKLKNSIRSSGYNMGMLKTVDHSGCKHRYLKFNDNKVYSYVNFQTNELLPKEIVTQMDALNLT